MARARRMARARDRRRRARPLARGVAAPGRADARASRSGAPRRDRDVGARRAATSGRGCSAAVVRDGWEPSAGVAGPTARALRSRPASGAGSSLQLTPMASRRPPRRAGHHPLVRAARPLVPAGDARRAAAASACCRPSTRACTCRRGSRGCASSTAHAAAHPRPGHRVRLAARVRARRRRALDRLAGHGAARATPRCPAACASWCAPGGPSATAAS